MAQDDRNMTGKQDQGDMSKKDQQGTGGNFQGQQGADTSRTGGQR